MANPEFHIRAYAPGDALRVSARPEQAFTVSRGALKNVAASQDVKTISYRGRPVIVGGFLPDMAGHVIAWAVVSGDIPLNAWPKILRAARRALIEKASQTRRITAFARADWPQARRTLMALGFVEEGVLKDYLEDGDAVIARHYG